MGLRVFQYFIAVLFITNIAFGQETAEPSSDSTKWKYQIDLNVSGRLLTGTFNQFIFSPRFDFDIHSKRWHINNITHYHFNETNKKVIEDNWYQMLTISYFVKGNKLFPTAFYNFENNLMFRVNSRHLAGLGLSTQKRWKQNFVQFDIGAGYENTLFNGTDFENSAIAGSRRDKELLMFRLVQQHQFWQNRITFSNVIFYRHSLSEGQDFFIRAAPTLSFKVAKGFSTSVSYVYRFENVYLKNLSNTNTALVFGLIYKIKNI